MMDAISPPANQDNRRVRVLIVDDAPQVRRDLRQFLDLTGEIDVIAEAADGQQAVRLAVELSLDVIIMDLEMPGMDGFEAACQIKARQPAPRIIILSVHADPENVERAKSVGADAFIVKGVDFKILIRAILGRNGLPGSVNQKKGLKT
jgi:DNA-binding NarL/FixJ family response regulator